MQKRSDGGMTRQLLSTRGSSTFRQLRRPCLSSPFAFCCVRCALSFFRRQSQSGHLLMHSSARKAFCMGARTTQQEEMEPACTRKPARRLMDARPPCPACQAADLSINVKCTAVVCPPVKRCIDPLPSIFGARCNKTACSNLIAPCVGRI